MKAYRSRMLGIVLFALIALGNGAGPAAAQEVIQIRVTQRQEMSCHGATPSEEALLRRQIEVMQPEVIPLRVFFVPHWKYLDNARIFHLHVPTGCASLMFTHLPSRTVFIDNDRYMGEEWLGYWMAHELGHLATHSVKEEDAERAAREYRKRLKAARHDLFMTAFQAGSRSISMRPTSEQHN